VTALAVGPDSGMFSGFAAAAALPQVDQEALVVVLVRLRGAFAERCGDVPGGLPALPYGVLGGHAADLAGRPPRRVHRAARSAGSAATAASSSCRLISSRMSRGTTYDLACDQ